MMIKGRLCIRFQITFGLLIGLLTGLLINTALANNLDFMEISPTQSPQPTINLQPYHTIPGGILVKIKLSQLTPPEVLDVIKLDESRLTPSSEGDSYIQLLDANRQILYSLNFQPTFLRGEPPKPVDELTLLFVLPKIEEAESILVMTPTGEVSHELSGK